MKTKTITTNGGSSIKIEFVRKVQDKKSFSDGYDMIVGREVVEYTDIKIYSKDGKLVDKGYELQTPLNPMFHGAMIAQGATARVGNSYLTQEVADMIAEAIAELETENPKSEEQIAIEQRQTEAQQRWQHDAPMLRKIEELERRMDSEYSDL